MDILTIVRNSHQGRIAPKDNFTKVFCHILGDDLNGEDSNVLEKNLSPLGTVNFFKERTNKFPDDIDSTVMTYLSLRKEPNKQLISKIVDMYNPNQGFRVYFGNKKLNRYDAVVDLNVIRFLRYFNIEQELSITATNRILRLLRLGDFKNGGRYYFSPFSFLFFLFKLHLDFGNVLIKKDFKIFREYLERNQSNFFLDKCMHNWLVHNMKLPIHLYEIQEIENDALYKSGSSKTYWNSKQILLTFKKINDGL